MGEFKHITTRCSVCNGVFDIGQESFSEVDVVLNGDLAKVTFFSCPYCGDYQVSSVDTMETDEIRKSIRMTMRTVKRLCSENKAEAAEKALALLNKKKEKLSEVVESLVSECKQQYVLKRVAGSEMLVKK